MSFALVVLAAGEGKRMKSAFSKTTFEVCGKGMVVRVVEEAKKAGAEKACVVVGHRADMVTAALGENAQYVTQKEQLGTGHAVMQAREFIKKSENVMILAGDTPLITAKTLEGAAKSHVENANVCTVLTARVDNPFGYGRIIRDENALVEKIVEQKDANEEEKNVHEINSGMYVFNSEALLEALDKLTNDNAQNEYYLTDTLAIMRSAGLRVGAYEVEDAEEISGVNDRVQLEAAEKVMQRRINEAHARAGVTIKDIDNTYIEDDVTIGRDSVIFPSTMIGAGTIVGENAVIGPCCRIEKSVIGAGCKIEFAAVENAVIKDGEEVKAFTQIKGE
ncbi:MAG: NTP transferase domain-containing protein [Clostridia bacterium]|nr:NTP transferase domain-containing protein [Clostridia bacterium]